MTKIVQADRDAAGALARAMQMENSAYLAEQGDVDHQPLVQAFARHRIVSEQATVERCAKVAEERFADRGWDGAYRNAGLGIATAIRSLSHTKGNDE